MPKPSEWFSLADFDGHEIDQYGNIRNKSSGRVMEPSTNQTGVRYVGLRNTTIGRYQNRAVSTLSADTFCPNKGIITVYGGINDTVVHLDGDQSNASAANLLWAPRWFAIAYHEQMANLEYHKRKRIVEISKKPNIIYRSYAHAAMSTGALPNAIEYAVRYNDGHVSEDDRSNFVHRVTGGYIFRSV